MDKRGKWGASMTTDAHDKQKLASDRREPSDRREFLQQCGRFAVVTPPVVSLMLTVGDKALAGNLATSPGKKDEKDETKTTTSTITTKTVTSTSSTVTVTNTAGELMHPGTKADTNLATVIDSMGLMKIG
jgi:hypothetical protein